MDKRGRYLSYMLRLWETTDGEDVIWRASLESPGSGRREGFASLQRLMEFLEAETESQGERRLDRDALGEAGGQLPR